MTYPTIGTEPDPEWVAWVAMWRTAWRSVRLIAVLVLVLGLTGPPAVSPAVEYRGWGCSVELGDREYTEAQVDTYVAQLAACTERHWPGWWDRA